MIERVEEEDGGDVGIEEVPVLSLSWRMATFRWRVDGGVKLSSAVAVVVVAVVVGLVKGGRKAVDSVGNGVRRELGTAGVVVLTTAVTRVEILRGGGSLDAAVGFDFVGDSDFNRGIEEGAFPAIVFLSGTRTAQKALKVPAPSFPPPPVSWSCCFQSPKGSSLPVQLDCLIPRPSQLVPKIPVDNPNPPERSANPLKV